MLVCVAVVQYEIAEVTREHPGHDRWYNGLPCPNSSLGRTIPESFATQEAGRAMRVPGMWPCIILFSFLGGGEGIERGVQSGKLFDLRIARRIRRAPRVIMVKTSHRQVQQLTLQFFVGTVIGPQLSP